MPFINLKTNVNIDLKLENLLKTSLGELIKIIPGKSENWLMIDFEGSRTMYFKGSNDRCAMIEVKIYGEAPASAKEKFTEEVTTLVSKQLLIPKDRIYVSYFETFSWGFAGNNF